MPRDALFSMLDNIGGSGQQQNLGAPGAPGQPGLPQAPRPLGPQEQMQQAFAQFLQGLGLQKSQGGWSFNNQPLPAETLSMLWEQFMGWYNSRGGGRVS